MLKDSVSVFLIHTSGGGKAAAAYVGDTRHIEKSLKCAVLAEFSVKNGEHNIDLDKVDAVVGDLCDASVKRVGEYRCGNAVGVILPAVLLDAGNVSGVEEPSALSCDADGDYLVLFGVEMRYNI